MKHFLSEPGTWKVASEFVDPAGKVITSQGESVISVDRFGITNDQWLSSDEGSRQNSYRITPVSATEMTALSIDPEQPTLLGTLSVEGGKLFFKYRREGSAINGYEIISRCRSTCYSFGALFDGEKLLQNWSATLNKTK